MRRGATGVLELGQLLVLLGFRKPQVITKNHFLKLITKQYDCLGRNTKQAKLSSAFSFLYIGPPNFLLPSFLLASQISGKTSEYFISLYGDV